MAAQDAVDAGVRYPDRMVARRAPDDAHGAEVALPAEMQDLLDDLGRSPVGVVVRHGPLVRQASLVSGLVGLLPPVKAGPANAEEAAGSADAPAGPRVL